MKCRVYKKEDHTAIVEILSKDFNINPNDYLIPENLKQYEYIICSIFDLKILKNGEPFGKLYFDGDCKIENLKYDQEWETILMPFSILKQKTIKRLRHKIDFALAAEDFEQFNKSNFYLNKALAEKNINYFYQESLNYLTENKIDKPVITKKLKDALGIKEVEQEALYCKVPDENGNFVKLEVTQEALDSAVKYANDNPIVIKIPENYKIYEPISYKGEDQIITTGFIQPDSNTLREDMSNSITKDEELTNGEENSISSDQSPVEKIKKKRGRSKTK